MLSLDPTVAAVGLKRLQNPGAEAPLTGEGACPHTSNLELRPFAAR